MPIETNLKICYDLCFLLSPLHSGAVQTDRLLHAAILLKFAVIGYVPGKRLRPTDLDALYIVAIYGFSESSLDIHLDKQ